jgi:unsaturated rhamnogalacturonyl hydrolase
MMTVLPLAKIGRLFGRNEYIEEAKYQFLIHIKYLADQATGLWFHGFHFDGYHNYANALWARGNAWVTIAIPEIIDILELKKGDFFREYIIEVLKRQVDSLTKFQSSSGLWHTLINDETSYLEASSAAGFAYGILKAVNNRLIDNSYREIAEKAVKGLFDQINDEGIVQNVSIGTGMGDNLDFYKNIKISPMPYGQSLTVLCLTEFLHSYI